MNFKSLTLFPSLLPCGTQEALASAVVCVVSLLPQMLIANLGTGPEQVLDHRHFACGFLSLEIQDKPVQEG